MSDIFADEEDAIPPIPMSERVKNVEARFKAGEITKEQAIDELGIREPIDSKITSYVGRALSDTLFGRPLGISREALGPLVTQPGEAKSPVKAFNEVALMGGSQLLDIGMRAIQGVIMSGAGAVAVSAEPFIGETDARRLFRDLNILGHVAGTAKVTAGASPVNLSVHARNLRKARDEKIDNLPVPPEVKERMKFQADQAEDLAIRKLGDGEVIPPPKESLKQLEGLNPQVFNKIVDEFEASGISMTNEKMLSDQIIEAIMEDKIRIGELDSIMKKAGVGRDELANMFASKRTEAGRTLGKLSQLSKRLTRLSEELGKGGKQGAEAAQEFKDIILAGVDHDARFLNLFRRMDNMRRGLMVSQPATAARNALVGAGRVGMDVMQDAIDIAITRGYGTATGKTLPKQTPIESFGGTFRALLNPKEGPLRQKLVDDVLEVFPKERSDLFLTFSSDITTGTGKMERGVQFLNALNRGQDFIFRRAKFASELDKRLRQKGSSLEDAVQNNRIDLIPVKDIQDSIQEALDFTFAANPKGELGKGFVNMVNGLPFAGTLAIPYPRFLTNSMRFMFEHSPAGLMRGLSKEGREAIASGDVSRISKPIVGATSFYLTKQMYDAYHKEGNEWYELTLDNGDTVDIRAFNPMASMFFVHDLVRRDKEGTIATIATKDYVEGIIGLNGRLGTGIDSVDKLLEGFHGIRNIEEGTRAVTKLLSGIAGQFATPLQTVSDLAGEFEAFEGENITRSTTAPTGPVNINPLLSRIPGLKQALPPKAEITRAAPKERKESALRQLTGITIVDPKNEIEKTLTRLDIESFELIDNLGIPAFDEEVRRHMGPMVEKARLGKMFSTEGFKKLPFGAQRIAVRKAFSKIRRNAEAAAIAKLIQTGNTKDAQAAAIKLKTSRDERRALGID